MAVKKHNNKLQQGKPSTESTTSPGNQSLNLTSGLVVSNSTSLSAGSVSREVHRHWLHAAVLQANAGQKAHAQRPGVHRP